MEKRRFSIDRESWSKLWPTLLAVVYVGLGALELYVPSAAERSLPIEVGIAVGVLLLALGGALFVPGIRVGVAPVAVLVPAGFLLYGALGPGWKVAGCGCLGGRLSSLPSVRLAIAAGLLAAGLALVNAARVRVSETST